MMTTNKETLKKNLDNLRKDDVYSLILFALYKVRDIPEYSSLSELIYVLNKDCLVKFLSVFGGTTIQVPTLSEFKNMISVLLLYEYVNLEGMTFSKAIKLLDKNEIEMKDIREMYSQVCEILDKYDFVRSEIN